MEQSSQIGGTAAFVAKQSEITARDLVAKVLDALPSASRDQQFDMFQSLLEKHPEYQRSVDWYFFVNISSYLTGKTERDRR